MFARSAAPDAPQGKAIHAINTKWGDDDVLKRAGRESIGFPVCKKKYAPFCFPVSKDSRGRYKVGVERRYGCVMHHKQRLAVIRKHGERKGWEPFGQWSLQKARDLAKAEASRLNEEGKSSAPSTESDDDSSEEGNGIVNLSSLCKNGGCSWKLKSAYDDVFFEINGYTESDAEDT